MRRGYESLIVFVLITIILVGTFMFGVSYEKWQNSDEMDQIESGCEKAYKKLYPETPDETLIDDCITYILQGD